MEDYYLVEVCMDIEIDGCEKASKIIKKYFKKGELTEEERNVLINYYIIYNVEFGMKNN
jgi:hypothetical protein